MATYNKFQSFVEAVNEKKHDFSSDVIKVALTNSAPSATNTQLSNITEISYTYCSSRTVTISFSSQSSGTYTAVATDLVLTASGGDIGPFRYLVFYNDTSVNDLLIYWLDYGSSITIADGGTLTIDFGAQMFSMS